MQLFKLSGTPRYWQQGPGWVRVMPNLLNLGLGQVPGYFITSCNTRTHKKKMFTKRSEFLIGIAMISNFFKEMIKTNIDLHEILDNFYLKYFLIEEMISYHIEDCLS